MTDALDGLEQEYDPAVVAEIVEQALKISETNYASFWDLKVLEKVAETLPKYLSEPDSAYVIAQIRSELYDGFYTPPIEKLHRLISTCVKCVDSGEINKADPQLPKWNKLDPDLLIVGMNPYSVNPYSELLVEGLKQAGFKSDRCCLTYLTRCPIVKPSKDCISNCVSFLHTEIHALKPKLIVPLGITVYASLTGDTTHKGSEIEGSVRWFGIYPYLCLSSPGYVQNQIQKGMGKNKLNEFHAGWKLAHKMLYGE